MKVMADPLFSRVRKAWQAGGAKELTQGHPQTGTQLSNGWWFTPAGYMDTRGVRDGGGNSAVVACMNTLTSSFNEPPVSVSTEVDGQTEWNPFHEAARLVTQPNPYMVGKFLWAYTLWANHLTGDAYWYKVRSAGGRPVQLWPLIPDYVAPRSADGSRLTPEEQQAYRDGEGPLIAYYEYAPNGAATRINRDDMVHLRLGLDPTDHRVGQAPLRAALREVLSDEEAGQFATSLLKNMGVPGVIISPDEKDDEGPSPEEADAMSEVFEQRFGGSRRGRPWIPTGRVKVDVVSFTPEQMNFDVLRRVPEERVSAVLGVPAILAGLGAGLDRGTYNNAEGLREFFTESKLSPLWELYADQLTAQLLPDFGPAINDRLAFNTYNVRALQDDQNEVWTRVGNAVSQGWLTVGEAKRAVGLDATDTDDVYLRPMNLMEIPMDGQAPQLVAEVEAALEDETETVEV